MIKPHESGKSPEKISKFIIMKMLKVESEI